MLGVSAAVLNTMVTTKFTVKEKFMDGTQTRSKHMF